MSAQQQQHIPHRQSATLWVPARVDMPELLDLGQGSNADVQASLDDLWRINRFLGGIHALKVHLAPRLSAAQGNITVVDLGTGAGQIARCILHWGGANTQVKVIGLDFSARNLAFAQHNLQAALPTTNEISLMQADALHLPFGEASVDYVISSLFLHHFTPEQVVALLRRVYACARRGIVMSDLVRGWLPLIAFRLGQPVFARSYLTRYDGAASVRRGYTPAELRAFAAAAGISAFTVTEHFPWRMTLTADKS